MSKQLNYEDRANHQLGGMDVSVFPGSEEGWLELVPSSMLRPDVLRERERGLSLLQKYCRNIEGFKVPSSRWVGKNFEVEKAHGVCLQGRTEGNSDEIDFYRIPTEIKLKALLIYLKAIREVNRNQDLVHDHNPDGIFIDYDGQSGGIEVCLVDPGDVGKDKHSGRNDYERLEVHDSTDSGITGLLLTFFDRKREPDCVPASLQKFVDQIKKGATLSDLIQAVENVSDSEFQKTEQWRLTIISHLSKEGIKVDSVEKSVQSEANDYNSWIDFRGKVTVDLFDRFILSEENISPANRIEFDKEYILILLEFLCEKFFDNLAIINQNLMQEEQFIRGVVEESKNYDFKNKLGFELPDPDDGALFFYTRLGNLIQEALNG